MQLVPKLNTDQAAAIAQREGITIHQVFERHNEKHLSPAAIMPSQSASVEQERDRLTAETQALEMKEAALRQACASWSGLLGQWEQQNLILRVAADQHAILTRDLADLEREHTGGLSWGAVANITAEPHWMKGSFSLMAGLREAVAHYPKFKTAAEAKLAEIEKEMVAFAKKWPDAQAKLPDHLQSAKGARN
jgi:hypothetical protein